MNDHNPISPPQWPLRFLRWFCREEYLDEIEGDLIELYEKAHEERPRRANWSFFWQVLMHFRPEYIRAFTIYHFFIHPAMLKHNILITYRSFLRHKSTFLINLTGLSTGLACVLLIYLWVQDELSVDSFHEKNDQLYQVIQNNITPDGVLTDEITPGPLAEAMVDELPEVEAATKTSIIYMKLGGTISHDDNLVIPKGISASENYFETFSFKLLQGEADQVLTNKNDIVISQSVARSLFNSPENALNQTVTWNNEYFEHTFKVSGVFEDLPSNSTERFDAVIHYDWVEQIDPYALRWQNGYAETYVVLKEGTDIDLFNQKIEYYLAEKSTDRTNFPIFVQQYSRKYLYGNYENGKISGGRIVYVKLFNFIALFILVIACINYMNLSTAQASLKWKQIGVKKVLGVKRKTLVTQFFSESMIMSIISLGVAIALVSLSLSPFNKITGKFLQLSFDLGTILVVVGIVVLTGLIAGSYPAFYLSRSKLLSLLKGKSNTSNGDQWIRKGLVVFQFALSVIFIVGVLVVNQQVRYTQTKNLGYKRDNVIVFTRDIQNVEFQARLEDSEAFMAELEKIPGVEDASNMYGSLLNNKIYAGGYSWSNEESDKDFAFESPIIGYGVLETLEMEILEGRSFSREYGDEETKIILNESAIEMMGLEDPLGKNLDGESTIIGIVKDFHYGSIHQQIKPLMLRFQQGGPNYLVKIKGGTEQATIRQIEQVYNTFDPEFPFEFNFLDTDYQALYESESKVAILSKYFTGLAIVISCLGLLGLAAFTADRRQKEIGIRKVLGASVFQLVQLLSTDFTKMVLLAMLIGIPISILISHRWLESFAYTINLQWWYFVGAAGITLLIAWLTVSVRTLKAATANPVDSLRDE